jgi:hypothetical protein
MMQWKWIFFTPALSCADCSQNSPLFLLLLCRTINPLHIPPKSAYLPETTAHRLQSFILMTLVGLELMLIN